MPPDENDDKPPLLYDQYGRRVTLNAEIAPEPTANPKRLLEHPSKRKLIPSVLPALFQFLLLKTKEFWKLALAFGLPSVLVTAYLARPTLSVESMESTPFPSSPLFMNTSIRVGGAIPIRDVSVWCTPNKVVNAWAYAVVLNHVAQVEEYKHPRLDTGDTFTVRCAFGWTLIIDRKTQAAAWTYGEPAPGANVLAIPFQTKNGDAVDGSVVGLKTLRIDDPSTLKLYTATDEDGTLIIHYKWRFFPLRCTKAIRAIGHLDEQNRMVWKTVPADTPLIRDPNAGHGFTLTLSGPKSGYFATMATENNSP